MKNKYRKLELKASNNAKLQNLFGILSISVLISFGIFVFGIAQIENYENWYSFIYYSVFFGILIGISLNLILNKIIPETIYFKTENGSGFLSLFFTFSIFSSFGLTRLLDDLTTENTQLKNAIIVEKSKSNSKNSSYWLFINYQGKQERLTFQKQFWEEHKIGDTIIIYKKESALGLIRLEEKDKI